MLEFTQQQQRSASDFNLQKKKILMHKKQDAEVEQMATNWLVFIIEQDSDLNFFSVESINYERIFIVAKSFQRIAKLISYALVINKTLSSFKIIFKW